MDRLRITSFAAAIIGLLSAHTAGAQVAANLTVVAGNGQITCQTCTGTFARFFQPMVVKVTDATGAPIPNKTVNWTLISSQGSPPFFADFTITDLNGLTSNSFNQASQAGSLAYPYLQSVIQASADAKTVQFTEIQSLSDVVNKQLQFINARMDVPAAGVPIQGSAGGTGDSTIQIHVDAFGAPIQNASVRIVTCPADGCTSNALADATKIPSASCATGAGADIGSVLTDANGNATCTVIFGPVSGTGKITALVGGVDPSAAPDYFPTLTGPIGYWQSGIIDITVRAGVAGLLTVSSGGSQNINPGQQTAPLVVKVTDSTGQNPINGATVVWSVTPAGAATFSPTSSTSNSQGLATTVATLSSTAVGTITIRAALSTASTITTTFNITANVTLSGLQKISGDPQSAAAGQAFAQPLVVQVNGSTGQPLANYPVNFSLSGPGSLSAQSVSTDSAGRAQVTVTAGSAQGTVTVTASAGSFTQTFSLTVIPPGPSLTVSGFVNGADFQIGALSPCSIATILGSGIATTVQGVVVPGNIVGPLPYTLANVKVSFGNSQAPIFNVANVNGQQQVTVQVPCDVTPGNVPVTVNVSGGSGTITVPILPASPGVFQTASSDGVRRIVAARPDGSFVSIENPARRGEIIRVYVTGLGTVAPPIATNSIPVPGTDSIVSGQIIVGVNNAGTRLVSARLAPNLIGVYEVAFQVPTDAATGNDIVFSVGINATGDTQTRYSAGTKIPIL